MRYASGHVIADRRVRLRAGRSMSARPWSSAVALRGPRGGLGFHATGLDATSDCPRLSLPALCLRGAVRSPLCVIHRPPSQEVR